MGFSLVLKTKGTVKCLGVGTSSFRMNSKRIGNIGEAKALAKFVELGIPVYIPFGDNESADLIAEFNGKLNKIQCKTTAAISEQSIITWNLRSIVVTTGNRYKVHISAIYGCNPVGRMLALGASCPWFESKYPYLNGLCSVIRLAQDICNVLEEFKSHKVHTMFSCFS